MIITCPHCQTKYQVTYDAIGSAGRKVQCAHCHRDWQQAPPAPEAEPDPIVAEMSEDGLDEALMSEAQAVAEEVAARLSETSPPAPAPAPGTEAGARPGAPADAAALRRQQKAFSRRHDEMVSRLPLARLRRSARVAGALLLAGLLALAYFGRVPIVDRYPALAGLYAGLGLGVNVVGLDFSNVESGLESLGGRDVLSVSAQIVGLMPRPQKVPPVVVSLLDAEGRPVYEWSVQTRVPDLMAGERASFDTRLSSPPKDAVRVRLSFAGGTGETQDRPRPQPASPASSPEQN